VRSRINDLRLRFFSDYNLRLSTCDSSKMKVHPGIYMKTKEGACRSNVECEELRDCSTPSAPLPHSAIVGITPEVVENKMAA
jgi:hypothetical protein